MILFIVLVHRVYIIRYVAIDCKKIYLHYKNSIQVCIFELVQVYKLCTFCLYEMAYTIIEISVLASCRLAAIYSTVGFPYGTMVTD